MLSSFCYSLSFFSADFLIVLNDILLKMLRAQKANYSDKLCIYSVNRTDFEGSPGFALYVTLYNLLIFFVSKDVMILKVILPVYISGY